MMQNTARDAGKKFVHVESPHVFVVYLHRASHVSIQPAFRRFQRARSGVCLKSPAGPPVTHQHLGAVLSAVLHLWRVVEWMDDMLHQEGGVVMCARAAVR